METIQNVFILSCAIYSYLRINTEKLGKDDVVGWRPVILLGISQIWESIQPSLEIISSEKNLLIFSWGGWGRWRLEACRLELQQRRKREEELWKFQSHFFSLPYIMPGSFNKPLISCSGVSWGWLANGVCRQNLVCAGSYIFFPFPPTHFQSITWHLLTFWGIHTSGFSSSLELFITNKLVVYFSL